MFNKFILRASSHIQSERHSNINEFIEELMRLVWLKMDNKDATYYDRIFELTSIIGRDEIVEETTRILEARSQKSIQQLGMYIEGEDGSGKSRLVREICHICIFGKFNYLLIHPTKYTGSLYAMRLIVRHIIKQGDVPEQILKKYEDELAAISPEDFPHVKSTLAEDFDELRINNRIYSFFIEYTQIRFTVLIVDDAEYLSELDKIFFKQLLSVSSRHGFFIVFVGNDSDEWYREYSQELLHMKFSALSLDEMSKVVQATLGVSDVPYQFIHRLMMETQGTINMIHKLIRQYYDKGVIWFNYDTMNWEYSNVDKDYHIDVASYKDFGISKFRDRINDKDFQYLRRLSFIKGSFNMEMMFYVMDVSEEEGYGFIERMEDVKILSKRISDTEYVFSFANGEVRKAIESGLEPELIVEIARRCAFVLEKQFREIGKLNETLVEYQEICEEYETVAHFAEKFASQYLKEGNYFLAVDLYERAKRAFLKLEQQDKAVVMTLKLCSVLINAGRYDIAEEQLTDLRPVLQNVEDKHEEEILLLESKIKLYHGNYEEVIANLENYKTSNMELGCVLLKCLDLVGEYDKYKTMVEDLLQSSLSDGNFEYSYFFNVLKYTLEQDIHNSDYLIEVYQAAIRYYDKYSKTELLIATYDLLGKAYISLKGNVTKARENFRLAHNLATNMYLNVHSPEFFFNVAESYMFQGNYSKAEQYFEESAQKAEQYKQIDLYHLSQLRLIKVKMYIANFGASNTILSKIEHKINTENVRDYIKKEFALLSLEYDLAIKNNVKVKNARYVLDANSFKLEQQKFALMLIDIRIEYQSNTEYSDKSTEKIISLIEFLMEKVRTSVDIKSLRVFIQELIISFISQVELKYVDKLQKLDDKLSELYTTKPVRFVREIADASLSEQPTLRMKSLLDSRHYISNDILWKTLIILGDAYLADENEYQALSCYLQALDTLSDIIRGVPTAYKKSFISNDPLKTALKQKINFIILKNISPEDIEYSLYSTYDFFNVSLLDELYQTESFFREMQKAIGGIQFDSDLDFLSSFHKDESDNFLHILNYFLYTTMGERGYIFILDETEQIQEVISSDGSAPSQSVMKLLSNVSNEPEGLFVSKLSSKSNISLLSDNQKGLIYFPITENQDKKVDFRRRFDTFGFKKKVIAYVVLESANVINRFNQTTFEITKALSNLLGVFIDNYNLKKNSSIDKLTGVYLRKYIEQQFAEQLAFARKEQLELSVIMLDIDNFKKVNDTYGHRKGDEILSNLGKVLKKTVRSSDFSGRYGGEEFIILLPETDAASALMVAEKVRVAVEKEKMLGEEVPLTISLGIATYPSNGINEEELVEKADQALYVSKHRGKNRATAWSSDIVTTGQRVDSLAGILTGHLATDHRNAQAVMKLIKQVDSSVDGETARTVVFQTVLDVSESTILEYYKFNEENRIVEAYRATRGKAELEYLTEYDEAMLQRAGINQKDEFFIDWSSHHNVGGIPDWYSVMLINFRDPGRKALVIIKVPISQKEYAFPNFNMIESIKPIIENVIFDR